MGGFRYRLPYPLAIYPVFGAVNPSRGLTSAPGGVTGDDASDQAE